MLAGSGIGERQKTPSSCFNGKTTRDEVEVGNSVQKLAEAKAVAAAAVSAQRAHTGRDQADRIEARSSVRGRPYATPHADMC
eukprot:6177256-Pleurochrysis_carterae.AAC.4